MSRFARKTDWEKDAKCLGIYDVGTPGAEVIKQGLDWFYPPREKALYETVADTAKDMCKGKDGLPPCPVKRECLLQAIRLDEEHGIWGGMSHRERNALVRKANKTGKSIEELVEALDRTWEK